MTSSTSTPTRGTPRPPPMVSVACRHGRVFVAEISALDAEAASTTTDPYLQPNETRSAVAAKAAQQPRTHCRRGHELVGDNVKVRATDGVQICRECERLRSAARRGDHAARTALANEKRDRRRQGLSRDRGHYLRRKYGLTLERFEALLDAQGGACGACGTELVLDQVNTDAAACVDRAACVDQCATSGAIRGIVCRRCQNVIARLAGDADLAGRIAEHLRRPIAGTPP
jgi:hypothetical protein